MPQGLLQSMPALATSLGPMNITQAASNPCTTTHGIYAITPAYHLIINPKHYQYWLYVVGLGGALACALAQ